MNSMLNILKICSKENFIDINKISKEDSPFSGLIKKLTDKEKDDLINFKIEIPKMFYFLLLNKSEIHQYLYDSDKNINIDTKVLGNNFHNYFYLVKLIEDENEIINYEYDLEIIDNLNIQKSKGDFYDVLITKIKKVLIDTCDKSNDEIKNQINNEINSTKIKGIKFNDNIDEIYINLVIIYLLKSGKIEEKNEEEELFVKNFIEQLDLENIEMTKTMYKELVEYFNDKSKIDEVNIYDKNKINFCYNLFKYILKNQFYIYQINFLFKLKKDILKNIGKKNEKFIELINNYKNPNNERFKYVINFLVGSQYYFDKIIQPNLFNKGLNENSFQNTNESISENSNFDSLNKEKMHSSSSISQNKYSVYTNVSENLASSQSFDKENDILSLSETKNFEILKYEKTGGKSKGFVKKQIIERNVDKFLEIDSNEIISNIDEYKKHCGLICWISSKIGNVVVVDKFNIPKEENNVIKYDNDYFKITEKMDTEKKYIIAGDIGLLVNFYENGSIIDNQTYVRVNYTGGRKIIDNVYAFVSNKIYQHGSNILVILDLLNHSRTQIIKSNKKEIGQYSFNIGNNSLYLIDVDKYNKYKILLCACKSYVKGTKNGILMILIEINNKDFMTFTPEFYPTDDFEVNCFLPVYENKDRYYYYILVGGFEVGKRRGNVQLYRLSCNIKEKKTEIQYIQDAIEDFSDFEEFNGMINNIVKYKENDVKISCLYGNDYIFNLPQNDDYIDFYESLF